MTLHTSFVGRGAEDPWSFQVEATGMYPNEVYNWPMSDIDTFLTNVSWAIRSTYHTVLKASPGGAKIGRDMLFDIPFLADWNKIGDFRQRKTDLSTEHENRTRKDWDYKVSDKVLLWKDSILRKSESRYDLDPWTITSVHTNGTIRVQCGSKLEWLNIRRVTPYLKIKSQLYSVSLST